MPYEILYDKTTGQILTTRRIAAPRADLQPDEGQSKLFLDFDFGRLPILAYKINLEKGQVEAREDFVPPERDVRLALSCDAPAVSPIDGIPALPADGTPPCECVQERGEDGGVAASVVAQIDHEARLGPVDLLEDPPHHLQAGDDAGVLGQEDPFKHAALRNCVERRDIAVADVFGERISNNRIDLPKG